VENRDTLSIRTYTTQAQFWQNLKAGERAGLESLYRLYANPLFNYGSKFSADKDFIRECIQELFVTLWTRRTFLGEPSSVKNYLFKAIRLSIFKKGKLSRLNVSYDESEHYEFDAKLTIEDTIIIDEQNHQTKKRLEASLNQLTPRQREAIFLKFYEGLDYEEIAEIMNITVKGSYKVVARAVDALRTKLKPDEFLLLLFFFSAKLYR
jgi:RNA polymerase sigma factor (sigma-70 family)